MKNNIKNLSIAIGLIVLALVIYFKPICDIPNFIRIHRSYIINRNYVKSFSGDQIQLINGERITIGRTYRKKIDH